MAGRLFPFPKDRLAGILLINCLREVVEEEWGSGFWAMIYTRACRRRDEKAARKEIGEKEWEA